MNPRGFRRVIVGLVMTGALGGCSAASSSPSTTVNTSTSTTTPATTTTSAAPQVAPIGSAIHLVDHVVIGGNQLVQAATIKLVGVIDPATPAQPVPSWMTNAGGGRWIAMRLEATNDGPSRFGSEASRYSPTLEFQTDRKISPIGTAFPLNMVGCPALNYFLLEPDSTTMGCVSLQIPPGSALRTLDVALAFSGGGDIRPIAEWTLT